MREVIVAFGKAGRDLLRADIVWQALWPPVVALALWTVVGFSVWTEAVLAMMDLIPDLSWSWWDTASRWAAAFLVFAAFGALVYFTATLLIALFALPKMVAIVAARDYPDLARRGERPFSLSLANTLAAGAVFMAGWLLLLPLLLVPGAVLVLPLAWAAWLNQRVFRVDTLAEHATRGELAAIVAREKPRLYLAGLGSALVAHVPLLNLMVPAFTALVYVHLCLPALRRLRQGEGIAL